MAYPERWVISDHGAEWVCQRMRTTLTTLEALKYYWTECLSDGAKRHPMVKLTKDQLKEILPKAKGKT